MQRKWDYAIRLAVIANADEDLPQVSVVHSPAQIDLTQAYVLIHFADRKNP